MQLTPRRQSVESTPHRTPVSQRRTYLSFHQSHPRSRQQGHHQYHQSEEPQMIEQIYEQEAQQAQNVIWGTNISIETVQKEFRRFILQFETSTDDQGTMEKIYLNKLYDYQLDQLKTTYFQISGVHLKEWDTTLYHQLIYYPAEIITLLDGVIQNIYHDIYIEPEEGQINAEDDKESKRDRLMISIINLDQISLMRKLEEKHINRLICFRGIVIRCSEIYPEMKTATFQCQKCKTETSVELTDAKVQQPKICVRCKQRNSFEIVHKFCGFTDKQYIKIQELPEYVPEGQTPTSMNIVCYDSNVNGMRPGDRVQIVGLYRCQGRKLSRFKCNLQTIFYTFVDLISYRILQENKFKASIANQQTYFTDDQKEEFLRIANSKNVINDLIESFASSIYGHQNIKKGLLCQIFGGTEKQFEGRGRFRSDINICLCGDPSTAKSQLLKQVYSIAPRGIYTSGKGSSAVGLTANVRKDPETKEFILESGALVLSDLGICCIDEFDKMDDNSKLILLEAMQQQTISVAKAGIVCQLNSRTSILSAANPVLSKYDPKRSVVDNINLPPALMSRFDLIYIILDIPNQKMDRKLALHILSLYSGKSAKQKNKEPKISRSVLTKYITYAREYISPQITDRAAKKLTDCYMEMRKLGTAKKTISATPRQLESLIRISEAFAKMKLANKVEEQDVSMAHELIQDALQQSATDPTTGMIDMDVLVTGHTSASRRRVEEIIKILQDLFQANASTYLGKKTQFAAIKQSIIDKWKQVDYENQPKQEQIKEALQKLQKQGHVNLFGDRLRPSFKYLSIDL